MFHRKVTYLYMTVKTMGERIEKAEDDKISQKATGICLYVIHLHN